MSVGSSAVGGDEDPVGVGIFFLAHFFPPFLMVATAKTEVSWSIPTETQALLSVRS